MGRFSARRVIVLLVVVLTIEGLLFIFLPSRLRQPARPTETDPVLREVPLGKFEVSHAGGPHEPVRMQAEIHVAVVESEHARFERWLQKNQFRVREAIGGAMRSASAEELREPELGTLKRRMHRALSEATGPSGASIQDVVVSSFFADPF